jgi:hypothetical protein
LGKKPRRHATAKVGIQPRSSAVLQLIAALKKAKIPFLIVGMGAATLQGSAVVTHDLDLWIGSSIDNHDRVLIAAHELDVTSFDDFHIQLEDGSLINFTYEMKGLGSFSQEAKRSLKLKAGRVTLPVLSMQRIYASKRAVNRPKDRVHLFYLRRAMRLAEKAKKQ